MTEKELIERLMFRAADCLKAQEYYYRTKTQTDLRAAKRKETLLKNAIHALKKRGYTPHVDSEAEQLKILANVSPNQ